jgi:murein L,D-transpeptidase YafK
MKQILILFLALLFQAGALAADPPGDVYEKTLLETIKKIQSQNHDAALDSTRDLIRQYPHSKLGQMLYADLLLAKAEPLTQIGSGIGTGNALQDFQHEIQQRWQHESSPAHQDKFPQNILSLAEDQPFAILVDQLNSRIYVYRNENGIPVLETDYFITIGLKGYGKERRGDQKTPIGIYHVTRYIDGDDLPDLYGEGAFPINYPNAWDRRKNRTGDGIWIHGTPSYTYNRSPWASNGCIVVSNPDFLHIDDYIDPDINTPVIVTKQVNWLSRVEWLEQRKVALKLMTDWIADWESLDHDRYRSHYSRTKLNAGGRGFKAWDSYKRRVNSAKSYVDINYSNLSIFQYPGEKDLLLMQYEQTYRSSNLNVDSPKEIYWRKSDAIWQIVHEGNRKLPTALAKK